MWYLLSSTGIVPGHFKAVDDDDCPWEAGVGFTDLGSGEPYWLLLSSCGPVIRAIFEGSTGCIMRSHVIRMIFSGSSCLSPHLSGNPGTKSGSFKGDLLRGTWRFDLYQRLKAHTERAGAPPKVIAFTGKRQFQHLFDGNQKVDYGLQTIRPPGWPFRPEHCQVFVLTSSSGASALTNEQREAPYRDLAALLAGLPPWQPLDEGAI
jgi:TDG/mug DNA glycosylase family protein